MFSVLYFYISYRWHEYDRAAESFETCAKCSEKLSRQSAPEGFLCLWHTSHFPCLLLSSLSHWDKGYSTTGILSAKSDKMLLFPLFQDLFPKGSFYFGWAWKCYDMYFPFILRPKIGSGDQLPWQPVYNCTKWNGCCGEDTWVKSAMHA